MSITRTNNINFESLPNELWFAISNVLNHIAAPGLALTSKRFFELIGSEEAWEKRTHSLFTTQPCLQSNEKMVDYYLRLYEQFNIHQLNAETPVDFKFNLLAMCIDEGLEQLARRLINEMPDDYFTEEKCLLLFNKPGLCLNNNISIAVQLVGLIHDRQPPVFDRLIARGCFALFQFSKYHQRYNNIKNINPTVLKYLWGLSSLPSQTVKSVFNDSSREAIDFLITESGILEDFNADEYYDFEIHFCIIATFNKFFSTFDFILNAIPPEKLQAILTPIIYCSPFENEEFSEFPTFVAKLLDVLPLEIQQTIAAQLIEFALRFLNQDRSAFDSLPLPQTYASYINTRLNDRLDGHNNPFTIVNINIICYISALANKDCGQLAAFINKARSLLSNNKYIEIVSSSLSLFLSSNLPPLPIGLLISGSQEYKFDIIVDTLSCLVLYEFPPKVCVLFFNLFKHDPHLLTVSMIEYILINAVNYEQCKNLLLETELYFSGSIVSFLPLSILREATHAVLYSLNNPSIRNKKQPPTKSAILLLTRGLIDSPTQTLAEHLWGLITPPWEMNNAEMFMQALNPQELNEITAQTLFLAWDRLNIPTLNEFLTIYKSICDKNERSSLPSTASYHFSFWQPFVSDHYPGLPILMKSAFIATCESYKKDYTLFKNTHDAIANLIIAVLEKLPERLCKYSSFVLKLLFIALSNYLLKTPCNEFDKALAKLNEIFPEFRSKKSQLPTSHAITLAELVNSFDKVFNNRSSIQDEIPCLINVLSRAKENHSQPQYKKLMASPF